MNPAGMLFQQEPGVSVPFWESIPTSVQVLVGGVALASAGWRWFLRPRMAGMMTDAVSGVEKDIAAVRKESQEAHAAIGDRIDRLKDFVTQENKEIRAEIAVAKEDLRAEIAAVKEDLSAEIAGVKADTAKLSGAVDVLTAVVLRGDGPEEDAAR